MIVETDAQSLVKLWNSPDIDRSEIVTTMKEIQELCRSFEEFRLKFIQREANELAHLCAKFCNSSRRRCLWINYVPAFLTACVMKECTLAT